MLSVILSLQNPVCINYLAHSVTQSCLTLCGPMDCSLPGFSVCGIFQARILEWLPLPTPGGLSNPGIKPKPFASPALAGRFFTTCATWEAPFYTGSHFSLGNLRVRGPIAHVTSCCHIEQCRFQTKWLGKTEHLSEKVSGNSVPFHILGNSLLWKEYAVYPNLLGMRLAWSVGRKLPPSSVFSFPEVFLPFPVPPGFS